jgi:cation transport ATPase
MAKSIFALNRPLTPQELTERRRTLVRLGLAWLAMMQVMMFALPGYLRVDAGPNDSLEVLDWAIFLMNWASFVMTAPVVLYAAWPMWQGLASAIEQRRINMDVPVTISIIAAFVPSAIATTTGSGEVYFDSVTMFVAFLLTARYFETRARQSVDLIDSEHMQAALCEPLLQRSDRVATYFILAQLAFSLLIALIWFKLEPEHALTVLVSMLVMSCPCALSLAAPVSLAATHATIAAYPAITVRQRSILFERTRKIAKQNLYGALTWHVLTMPLAAVGLVTPWVAALAMFVSSAVVVANAWRLYRVPELAQTDSGRSFSPQSGESA